MTEAGTAGGAADRHAAARTSARRWPVPTFAERVFHVGVALACLGLLAVGWMLTPSPMGADTHTQLGLPPCGMLERTGRPCPTCGATTSFSLAAHGRFWDSFVNQPFGFTVFWVTVAALAFSIYSLVARRSWLPIFERHHAVAFIVIMVVILFVSWAYKWWLMSRMEGAA